MVERGDLERRLSAELHREAAQLVPGDVTQLKPRTAGRKTLRPARILRWREPALVAATVVALAIAAAVAVTQQGRSSDSATASSSRSAGSFATTVVQTPARSASPIEGAKIPSFECQGKRTIHATQARGIVLGIAGGTFCAKASAADRMRSVAVHERGLLRATVSADQFVAGLVDESVDTVTWSPGDNEAPTTLPLYDMGQLRAFAFPTAADSGSVSIYSGSTLVTWEWSPA